MGMTIDQFYAQILRNIIGNDPNGGNAWKVKIVDFDGDIIINSSENLAQVNGITVNTGAGISTTGTQRVAIGGDADNAPQIALTPAYVGGRAEDVASLPTFTAGDAAGVRVNKDNSGILVNQGNLQPDQDIVANIDKPDATSAYAASYDVSGALETSSVTKASAGTYNGIKGYNSGPAQFILVFNSATVPADGAVTPIDVIKVPTLSNFSSDNGKYSQYCSAGISWCNSTSATPFTKALGAADCFAVVQYK